MGGILAVTLWPPTRMYPCTQRLQGSFMETSKNLLERRAR